VRIVASGLFSSCATPEIVWPSAGELLGLQQLVVQVARLILEALPLADVAHQRLDADAALVGLGVRGDLHPDRHLVGAAQPQQVVGHRSVARQPPRRTHRAPADRRSARRRTAGSRVGRVGGRRKPNISLRCGVRARVWVVRSPADGAGW
jgi:hypothetical protein